MFRACGRAVSKERAEGATRAGRGIKWSSQCAVQGGTGVLPTRWSDKDDGTSSCISCHAPPRCTGDSFDRVSHGSAAKRRSVPFLPRSPAPPEIRLEPEWETGALLPPRRDACQRPLATPWEARFPRITDDTDCCQCCSSWAMTGGSVRDETHAFTCAAPVPPLPPHLSLFPPLHWDPTSRLPTPVPLWNVYPRTASVLAPPYCGRVEHEGGWSIPLVVIGKASKPSAFLRLEL